MAQPQWRLLALACILVPGALAGCLGDAPGPDPGPGAAPAAQPDGGEAGSVEGAERPDTTTAGPNVTQAEVVLKATIGTPAYSVSGTDIAHLAPVEDDNVTGYVIEIAWSADTPNQQDLALWVRGHTLPETTGTIADSMLDPPPLVKVEGPSPLAIPLAVQDMVDQGGYSVFVRAAADPVGVNVADLTVTAAVSRFEGIRLDETHRALA